MNLLSFPIELRLEIALKDLYVFNLLCRTNKELHNYVYSKPKILSQIKKSFIIQEDEASIYTEFSTQHLLNNKRHSEDDLPAYIIYNPFWDKEDQNSFEKHEERWYKHGKIYRDNDLPAKIEYRPSGKTIYTWYNNGKIHRDNILPAKITYKRNIIIKQVWYKHGKKHRNNNLPSVIRYKNDGVTVKYKNWYKNNKYYRHDNLPTTIVYDGNRIIQIWYNNGEFDQEEILARNFIEH